MMFAESELDLDVVFENAASVAPEDTAAPKPIVLRPVARPIYARKMIHEARRVLEPFGRIDVQHVTASLAGLPIGQDPDMLFAPGGGRNRGITFVIEFRHFRGSQLETRDIGTALEHRQEVRRANRGIHVGFVFATNAALTPLQRRLCLTDALAVIESATDGSRIARWLLDRAGVDTHPEQARRTAKLRAPS